MESKIQELQQSRKSHEMEYLRLKEQVFELMSFQQDKEKLEEIWDFVGHGLSQQLKVLEV